MILEYVLDELNSYCLHITHTSAAVTVLPAGRKRIEHLVDTEGARRDLRVTPAPPSPRFQPSLPARGRL